MGKNIINIHRAWSVIAVEQWVAALVGAVVVEWLHPRATVSALHRLLHALQFEFLVVRDPDALIFRIVIVDAVHL